MAKRVDVNLKTQHTLGGWLGHIGFLALPIVAVVVIARAGGQDTGLSDEERVALLALFCLFLATIPAMLFGRKVTGSVVIEQSEDTSDGQR